MPTPRQGTRFTSTLTTNNLSTRNLESSYTQDKGMTKYVVGPLVLDTPTATISSGGPNSTLNAFRAYQAGSGGVPAVLPGPDYLYMFQVGDVVHLQGTTMNDGLFEITSITSVVVPVSVAVPAGGMSTVLTVTPPPKTETANANGTMRTL